MKEIKQGKLVFMFPNYLRDTTFNAGDCVLREERNRPYKSEKSRFYIFLKRYNYETENRISEIYTRYGISKPNQTRICKGPFQMTNENH